MAHWLIMRNTKRKAVRFCLTALPMQHRTLPSPAGHRGAEPRHAMPDRSEYKISIALTRQFVNGLRDDVRLMERVAWS